jgi:hypothetical protein
LASYIKLRLLPIKYTARDLPKLGEINTYDIFFFVVSEEIHLVISSSSLDGCLNLGLNLGGSSLLLSLGGGSLRSSP